MTKKWKKEMESTIVDNNHLVLFVSAAVAA